MANKNEFIIPQSYMDIFVQPNFPFIEQDFDSITIYQMLSKIAGFVKYIAEYLQSLNFDDYTKYVDEQISNLEQYIDNQDKKIYNYIDDSIIDTRTYISEEIVKVKQYTDNEISKLNTSLLKYIEEQITIIRTYIDNQDNIITNYIDEQITKVEEEINDIAKNGIKVYNPITGKYEYLQGTLDDLYGFLRYEGLTALEYDTLGLTAESYDTKNLTARQYDLYAKEYLGYDERYFMISPFTGKYAKIVDVINQLANFHKSNPISAEEYDSLELTAQNYDDKEITAYNYDFTAKSILMPQI